MISIVFKPGDGFAAMEGQVQEAHKPGDRKNYKAENTEHTQRPD